MACNVEKMLKENKLKFGEIGLLGVCTGPGSFTGVRAGLAFARGLALGSPDLKLTGVSAFEVYANMLKESDRAFIMPWLSKLNARTSIFSCLTRI